MTKQHLVHIQNAALHVTSAQRQWKELSSLAWWRLIRRGALRMVVDYNLDRANTLLSRSIAMMEKEEAGD